MITRCVDAGSSETSVLICHAASCHSLEIDHLNELLVYLLSLLASGSRLSYCFCSGHPAVFIKLQDNKTDSGFSQTQQYICIYI